MAHVPSPSSAPGFHLPPPVIYALPFIGAHYLDRWRPAPFLPHAVAIPLGASLLVLAMIGFPALRSFHRARTSALPWRAASALVTDGPYRFSRNPMYVALTLLYLGGTALVNSAWPLAFLPVILVVMRFWVIRHEEQHLEARFGEAYRAYCRRVRRWL